jgi:hypothetical protein
MVNANMVNAESGMPELPETCKKSPVLSRFLAFKNTVNYNRRFELTIPQPRPAAPFP